MADSSDEDDDLQENILMDTNDESNERPKKKAKRKETKYIHEDVDHIVDLADIKAMSSIACEFLNILQTKNQNLEFEIFFFFTLQRQSQQNKSMNQKL